MSTNLRKQFLAKLTFLLILLGLAVIVSTCMGCKSSDPLANVDVECLHFKQDDIFCNNEMVAYRSAVELSYDDGEIVREATFQLTSEKFNDKAYSVIKFLKSHLPGYEIEVELKRDY